jgi:hypothetical protein
MPSAPLASKPTTPAGQPAAPTKPERMYNPSTDKTQPAVPGFATRHPTPPASLPQAWPSILAPFHPHPFQAHNLNPARMVTEPPWACPKLSLRMPSCLPLVNAPPFGRTTHEARFVCTPVCPCSPVLAYWPGCLCPKIPPAASYPPVSPSIPAMLCYSRPKRPYLVLPSVSVSRASANACKHSTPARPTRNGPHFSPALPFDCPIVVVPRHHIARPPSCRRRSAFFA